MISELTAFFFTSHSAVVIRQCNLTVAVIGQLAVIRQLAVIGQLAVEATNHSKSTQLNLPITKFLTITIPTTT